MADKTRYRVARKYPPYNVNEEIGRDPDEQRTKHLIAIGVLVTADTPRGDGDKPPAELTGLENLTVKEIEQYAEDEGYDLAGCKTKADKIAAILEAHTAFPVDDGKS